LILLPFLILISFISPRKIKFVRGAGFWFRR
jgi:hypothetical protein